MHGYKHSTSPRSRAPKSILRSPIGAVAPLIKHSKSSIQNQKSSIQNQKSSIQNQKSSIQNPKSSIKNQASY